MAVQTVTTKGNLMNTKKSLALAKNGYELLDRKRNILIREMMTLIDHATAIRLHRIFCFWRSIFLTLRQGPISENQAKACSL